MKKIFFLFLAFPMIIIAQKNNNGKVYDQHPAIEIADKFGQAWISGDVETLKSIVAKGFKMGSSMNNNPNYKGGDINNLVGQSQWMKNRFLDISLKDRGQAYSDAIEYKRSGLFVQTFQEFIAWDKETGFKIRTPFNATYVFDKSGKKIVRFWWSDNQATWEKWNLSRQVIKNGVIYKDHPNISKVRQIWYHLEKGMLDKVWKDFSPNAVISDVNSLDGNYKTLEEQKELANGIFKAFEMISIDEVGYPDYVDYEGNGGVVLAWFNMTLKNKKTGKNIVLRVHSQYSFNESGMINNESLYYNGNLLN